MARNGELPGLLGTVSTRRIPQHAELAVAVVVAAVVAVADIRGAIGFSSFCVLGYYALANVSAWTLRGPGAGRLIPLFGLVGCVALACALPLVSVLSGIAVLVLGVAAYGWLRLRAVGNGSEPE
jgi:APA family basic amino acid/polyamine antiporter